MILNSRFYELILCLAFRRQSTIKEVLVVDCRDVCEAAEHGADMIFIDTGNPLDAKNVIRILTEKNLRHRVRLVFAGGVRLENIDQLKTLDIDFLDIGRAIVDAPLLDMRLEIEPEELLREKPKRDILDNWSRMPDAIYRSSSQLILMAS